MDPARIAALLEPFLGPDRLADADLRHISTYIDILMRWNARINLTAIRDPEQIVTRHFGESFFAARHLFPTRTAVTFVRADSAARAAQADVAVQADPGPVTREAAKECSPQRKLWVQQAIGTEPRRGEREVAGERVPVADLGSGAGFPGLPIKLWAPHIALTLIESNHKKATFLREIVRALTLTNVNIQIVRAEHVAASLFNVVTLRAVERFENILPIAARLVAAGGRLALLIAEPQRTRVQAALKKWSWSQPVAVPFSRARILLIGTASQAVRSTRPEPTK